MQTFQVQKRLTHEACLGQPYHFSPLLVRKQLSRTEATQELLVLGHKHGLVLFTKPCVPIIELLPILCTMEVLTLERGASCAVPDCSKIA